MGIYQEFKTFAFKGNVLDMAVGIVLGVAFGNVVSSFVSDLLSPPIGLLLGGQDLGQLFWVLGGTSYDTLAQARASGATVITYGAFLNVVLEFLLVALALFAFVTVANRARRRWEKRPPSENTRACPACTTRIAKAATRCPACTSQLEPAEGTTA